MMFFLKFFLRSLEYRCINFFTSKKRPDNREKNLVVIRLDAIGDYVLFRNFLESIKHSKIYAHHHITLIGNESWKDLALYLDANFIDHFIWVDYKKFSKDFFYRGTKLKEILSFDFDVCISPAYSRRFFYSDWFVKLVNAREKIGSIGDTSNIKPWQKKRSDKWFHRLLAARETILFEFDRNREFFSQLLRVELAQLPSKPSILLDTECASNEMLLPAKPYAVMFIGSSGVSRKWPTESFAQVAIHLKHTYDLDIVLCGGPDDKKEAERCVASCGFVVKNLVGKTSLVDLLLVLKQAQVIVSNETSGPHCAVALNVPAIFVISNGNHFGRFTPYPADVTKNFHIIFHPDIEQRFADFQQLCDEFGKGSWLDIKQISVKSVINCIDNELEKRYKRRDIIETPFSKLQTK